MSVNTTLPGGSSSAGGINPVGITGAIGVTQIGDFYCSSATMQQFVLSGANSPLLLPSNSSRKKFIFYNGGTTTINVAFGSTASTASPFSFVMKPNSYFETQQPIFTGSVFGITQGGTGTLQSTEIQ